MKTRIIFVLFFLLVVGCVSARAEDFSADMDMIVSGQSMSGKIAVSGDKARMDTGGMATITRIDQSVVWVLMPDARTYMEMPLDSQHLAAVGAGTPDETEREFLGTEVIDGQTVEKHRVYYDIEGKQSAIISWTVPGSGIPVKTQSEDGAWTMQYRNIRQDVPDASLFEVPSGYQKMEMPMAAMQGVSASMQSGALGSGSVGDLQGLLDAMGQGQDDGSGGY